MNKLLILIAAFLLTIQFSNAQTEKGSQTIGLNMGFNINQSNNLSINPYDNSSVNLNSRTANFSFGPEYSYFIANNLDIGANFNYDSSLTTNTTENNGTNDSYPVRESTKNYSGDLFVRKYTMYKHKIGFRTLAYVGYGNEAISNKYPPDNSLYNFNSQINYYWSGVNLDLVYYPSKKIGFAANLVSLQYEHYNENNTNQGHNNGNNLNINFISNNLSLSIFYVFGGKG